MANRLSRRLRRCLVVGAMALTSACGGDRVAPAAPSPIVRSLYITGDDVVQVNGTLGLRLWAIDGVGPHRDVTASGAWSASGPVVRVEAPGVVRGVGPGQVTVSVSFAGKGATRSVEVIPAGTFRLRGTVTGPGAIGAGGARVVVTDSLGTTQILQTNFNGAYAIAVAPGTTRLSIGKDGYHVEDRMVEVNGHMALRVDLRTIAPYPDVSGAWIFRVSAAEACRGEGRTVPDEARSRSYRIAVHQDGPRLTADVSGEGITALRFSGLLEPGRMMFSFYDANEFGPSMRFIDRLPSGAFLSMSGDVATMADGERFVGTLAGPLEVFNSLAAPAVVSCEAEHTVVLHRPS